MKLATKALLVYSFLAKIPALFADDDTLPEMGYSPEVSSEPILDGETVEDVNEYPYFVSVYGCGGVLIAPDVVLTAAHCEIAFVGTILYIGGTNKNEGEQRTCSTWIIDPVYGADNRIIHDYALCKLDEPVTSIEPIKLHDGLDALSNGEELLVMGHGFTESFYDSDLSNELLHTTVKYTDDYESFLPLHLSIEDSQMFATKFNEEGFSIGGACRGDSGGPLVWRKDGIDTVVGVVSFGLTGGVDPCLRPSGYARVSYRYDWILATMWTLSATSPSTSPSTAPSSAPSTSPTPIDCEDKSASEWTRDTVQGDYMNCVWVKKKRTEKRCKRDDAMENCPGACNKLCPGSVNYVEE